MRNAVSLNSLYGTYYYSKINLTFGSSVNLLLSTVSNEEYKFYRNGEMCDTKIDFEDWELNSPAEWTQTTLFDTKDECCSNLFPYDYSGCMDRSPVIFKFEFCLEVGSLLPPIDCQTADIYANVMEDAINQGLGESSDANITRVGDATLTKVDGSTVCGERYSRAPECYVNLFDFGQPLTQQLVFYIMRPILFRW